MIREKHNLIFHARIIWLSDYRVIERMHIKVNGESREFGGPLTVAALAEHLKLNLRQVAVERNRAIVPRSAYGDVALTDGDEIEIVRFIGGG